MELKIKTVDLQEMVGKAIKCASNNKLIPLTSLMNVKVENNLLTLTTTDATNYFYTSAEVMCDDFEVSVNADLFTKLIQKTTCENVSLYVKNGAFVVQGNGSYTMELPLDENGMIIKFPKKITDDFRKDGGIIKSSTIKNILNYNKPSLAVSTELPALTCYYCGDSVITSDRFKICNNAMKVFDEPTLITAQLMELLGTISSENITVMRGEHELIFEGSNDTVYAPITEGIETFPHEAIMSLVDSEFESNCKISRVAVLNLIERLNLFVSPYDKRAVRLTFTKDGIMFSSKKSSGVELIPYVDNSNPVDYTCMVDIEMLRSQITSQTGETINLYYGSDIAIKMVSDNITQIVALAEDD